MYEPFLKYIKDNGGNISIGQMDYFCNEDSTILRNNLEKAGFAEHRYDRLLITEAGEQQLTAVGQNQTASGFIVRHRRRKYGQVYI